MDSKYLLGKLWQRALTPDEQERAAELVQSMLLIPRHDLPLARIVRDSLLILTLAYPDRWPQHKFQDVIDSLNEALGERQL